MYSVEKMGVARYLLPRRKYMPEVKLPCVWRDAGAKQKANFVVSSILKQPQTCDEAAPHKPYLSLTAHFIKYFLEGHTQDDMMAGI